MSENTKLEIYKKFDSEGIKGDHLGSMYISVNADLEEITNSGIQRIFQPDLSYYKLSQDKIEEIIIDYVFDTVNVRINSVNELMSMRSINGKPFFLLLESSKTTYCLALKKIPYSITLRKNDGIKSLGYIEEINGTLGLMSSSIVDLGSLKRVNGGFWVSAGFDCPLKSLSNLEYVGEDLNIKYSQINDLGKLKYVGGNLNLRTREPFSLGNLEFIGKNLMLSKRYKDKFNLDGIQIQGKIKYFEDKTL